MNQTAIFVMLGCIFAGMFISQMAHSILLKGAALVPPDERERIYQRQARFSHITSLIEYIGYGVLVLGIARIFGLIRDKSGVPWGLYCMAGAFVLLCVGKVLHSWLLAGAYRKETSESRAVGAAVRSALLITVFEVALAGGICWFIATRAVAVGGRSSAVSTSDGNGSDGTDTTNGSGTETPRQDPWIGQAEALKILGKDEEYLQLLAQIKEVRTKVEEGETKYRIDDVTGVKEAGLRSVEELRTLAKKQSAPPPQPPKQPPPSAEDVTPVAPPKQEAEPLRE
ncbi:MAG: hypothetical protein L6R28_08685 [Planctomycetes bacterium]|nr:hypothetical protein [Planctomycetota bacterium]